MVVVVLERVVVAVICDGVTAVVIAPTVGLPLPEFQQNRRNKMKCIILNSSITGKKNKKPCTIKPHVCIKQHLDISASLSDYT